MSSVSSLRRRLENTTALSYPLAIVLPLLGSWLTLHVHYLRALPFAMQFIALALVATLGGLPPSILGIFVAFISQNYLQTWLYGSAPLPLYDPIRLAIIFLGALIVSIGRSSRLRSGRKLEIALLDLQDRSAALIETLHSSKCASWVFDLDSGKSPRWYSGSYPIFGRPFSEIETMSSLVELLHPDDQPRLALLAAQMRSTSDPIVFEYRSPWLNGEIHTLEMRGTRVPGPRCVWRGLTMDITERRLAEAALLRSEKLAAMGRLASTVAHEVNNPLEAVTNLLFLARTDASITEPTLSYLATAERELARLSNITRLTLGFVRTYGSSTLTPVASTVEEVLNIFEHRLHNRGIALHRDFDPAAHILIAPHELRQIATNLISNAADAVSSVYVSPTITVRALCRADRAVLLIEDNGIGIPAANLQRIFEPFFSTKEEVGTGIGLWVTRELIERNSGTITVESNTPAPDAPTTIFRVEFPLASSVPAVPVPAASI
jgi:signal transduction histidine kinase